MISRQAIHSCIFLFLDDNSDVQYIPSGRDEILVW
jgi:hypothetical protein